MRRFLVRILAAAAGLWLADRLLLRFQIQSPGALALAAVLLAFVHALVRPVIVLLTLPITLLTLGLFLWLLNAGLLGLVALLVPGFRIDGLLPALAGAALVSVAGMLANTLVRPRHPEPPR
jgi:putative membrane protein